MIGPKQEQSLTGDGTAIQATGDVRIEKHYHGLQMSEVQELTALFLERQLPALRAEAVKAMHENTQEFLDHVVVRLAATRAVTQEAFAKPDAQICFNEALKASAEKGDQIDLEMLAEMVIGRLESDDNQLLKLIYEDTVKILPRLTGSHIEFLAYLVWMTRVRHTAFKIVSEIEALASRVLSLFSDGISISDVNKEYLVSLGVITINHVSDADNILGTLKRSYPFLADSKEALTVEAPALGALIDGWGKNNIPMCHLNSSGKLIGLLALQKIYGKLDLTIWIN